MRERSRDILIVEDNPDEALLAKRALARIELPLTVKIATDGEDAIAQLETATQLPDLVLLDLKLPRLSGFEVLEWIRNAGGLRVPVVTFSNSSEARDVQMAYDLGANSFLRKPVSFDDLVELFRNLTNYWLVWNESPPAKVTS